MAEETSAQQAYDQFWPKAIEEIQSLEPAGLKHQELPLARIKKVIVDLCDVQEGLSLFPGAHLVKLNLLVRSLINIWP